MIDVSKYPAIFSKVHNRGIPPGSFIETLVYAIRKLPDNVFGTDYRSKTEDDIYSWLHKHGIISELVNKDIVRRRAIMCEVLRVLGGFESSWDWKEGRDVTNASSNKPETTEAGIFQCSANSINFDASLVACFNWYAYVYEKPEWVDMKKSGFSFQWMSKNVPGYAIEHCTRLLRFTIRHHGPILRGEIFPWISLDGIREFESLLSNTPMSNDPTPTENFNYIIDPGHGGQDSGAVGSVDGKTHTEKTIVLGVSRALFELLFADPRFRMVSMTRHNDVFIDLNERANTANKNRAKLISIHANAGGGTGFECFTTPGKTESDALATALLSQYAEEFSGWDTRYDMADGDPDKEARFTVLTATKEAAVLFELGFMDRAEDLRRMTAPDFVERAARALYLGILRHEGLLFSNAPDEPIDATEAEDPITVPIESAEAAAFARGREEGVAAAIKKFDDLARDNANFKDFKPTEADFWQGQRSYVTGYLAADFLRKAKF